MTLPNGQNSTELVPELYALIDKPGPNATPEECCLSNLTEHFYKHIQKLLEDKVLSRWIATKKRTMYIEVLYTFEADFGKM